MKKLKRMKIYRYLDDPQMVEQILIEGGQVNKIERKSGKNALMMTMDKSVDISVMKLLLDYDIDINHQSKEGNTALHLCDDPNKLRLLLKYQPDLNVRNNLYHTPIFACNDIEKAKLLIDAGIDINIHDKKGNHLLKSLHTMDFELMQLFIDRGMNRFLEKRGLTLDTFLEEWSSIEVVAYFENKLKTQPELYKVKV